MTGYVYWNAVIMQAHDLSTVGPVCQNNLKSTIKHGGFYISFVVIVWKFTVFFYDVWFQVKENCTGTAIPGFTF